MRLGLAGILVLALMGCSAPHPEKTFFADFRNNQRSLAEGEISFGVDTSWQTWDASQASKIEGWGVQSPSGRCQGFTSANPIKYSVLREDDGYIVKMGSNPEIICNFGDVKSATFTIFPIINPRPLFDPDEIVGSYQFQINFVAVID